MRAGNPTTPNDALIVLTMKRDGYTDARIAERLGVSHQTVRNIIVRAALAWLETQNRPPQPPNNAHTLTRCPPD